MQYPRLNLLGDWQITSYPFSSQEFPELNGLAWVKDDQINILTSGDMTGQEILDQLGYHVSFRKGAAVASKRMSRMFRPYRYGTEEAIEVFEDTQLDPSVWDGMFQISRECVVRCTQFMNGLSKKSYARHMRILTECKRFEITYLDETGQRKGHAIVIDGLEHDIVCPVGISKREMSSTKGTFLGLNAIHAAETMKLDIQSLVNLHEFFGNENIIRWLKEMTVHVAASIRSGDKPALANMLNHISSQDDIDKLENWSIGEYLASGGEVSWFAQAVRAAGKQYKQQLISQANSMRFPIPGGGLYIAPASVGFRHVEKGKCLLDLEQATVYVADEDWKWAARRNGGFDGDDRHWTVCFKDTADDMALKVLFWRSPNQFGEYLLMEPMAETDIMHWIDGTLPELDSTLLPTPIEQQGNSYGSIPKVEVPEMYSDKYSADAVELTAIQCMKNAGILGRFCNVLMLYVAVHGYAPSVFPATLEAVIDFTVKEVGDLVSVFNWIMGQAEQLANEPIPLVLLPRITGLVDLDITTAVDHPLDQLMKALQDTMVWLDEEIDSICADTCPPVAIFELGQSYMQQAKVLQTIYGNYLRRIIPIRPPTEEDMEHVKELVLTKFNSFDEAERENILLGLASAIYTNRRGDTIRDGVLWNALGTQWIECLRKTGLVADVEWTGEKAELWYDSPVEPVKPIALYLKQVWYNLYMQQTGKRVTINEISKNTQLLYKETVRQMAPVMVGMKFTVADGPEGRKVALGPKGNVAAYLAVGQETVPNGTYTLISAIAEDGNLHAVLV